MNAQTIVVGLDGSAPSRAALRFALGDAHRRGGRVRMVWAFDPPEPWAAAYGSAVPLTAADVTAELKTEAQRMLDSLLAENPALASVPVETRILPGAAACVLLAAATDADHLVIGHRGRGGVASALLGSVGLQCALHAGCPVTIVRADPSDVDDDATSSEVAYNVWDGVGRTEAVVGR